MTRSIEELHQYMSEELNNFDEKLDQLQLNLSKNELDIITGLLYLYILTKCKSQKGIRLITSHNEVEALFKLQAKHLTEKKEKLDARGIYQTLLFICPICEKRISKDIKSPEDIVCSCGYRILSIPKMKNRFTEFKIMEK